jgi:hypothetical protein
MAESVQGRQSSEEGSLENQIHDRKRQRTAHAVRAFIRPSVANDMFSF